MNYLWLLPLFLWFIQACHITVLEPSAKLCGDLDASDPNGCVAKNAAKTRCAYNFTQGRCEEEPAQRRWPGQVISAAADYFCFIDQASQAQCIYDISKGIQRPQPFHEEGIAISGGKGIGFERIIIVDKKGDLKRILGIYISSPEGPLSYPPYSYAVGAYEYACAMRRTHEVDCFRALADGTATSWFLNSDIKAKYIAGGIESVCIILFDNSVKCFPDSTVPSPVGVFERIFLYSGDGPFGFCATKLSDRTLVCGNTKFSEPKNTAFRMVGLSTSVDAEFAVGLKEADNTLMFWGDTSKPKVAKVQADIRVNGQEKMRAVVVGSDFACAEKEDGAIVCFGNDTIKAELAKLPANTKVMLIDDYLYGDM